MKFRWGIFSIICLIGIAALAYWGISRFRPEALPKAPHLKDQCHKYFLPVPVIDSSRIDTPLISLRIEDMTLPVEIDLGFRGALSLSTDILEKLKKKTFLRSKPMWGFRGEPHEVKIYDISEIDIGRLHLWNLTAQEDAAIFRKNALIPKPGQQPSCEITARIGWEPFIFSNLFLDLANSQIAFCDGIDTLREHGYYLQKFAKAPLLVDRGLIEFHALTSKGSLRCILDTGASWNILHTENSESRSIEELAWTPESSIDLSSFKIANQEFGPIHFVRLPIKLPIHIDAILGMDFFLKHIVFIDFSTEQLYFAPTTPRTPL